jgi:putative membrane protein
MKPLILSAALLAFATPVVAQKMPNTMATGRDFVNTAASSDVWERAASRIAQARSRKADVKALAAMLETAHAQSSRDLAMASEQAGTGEPRNDLNPGQKRMLDALEKVDAMSFDKLWLQQQAQVHKDAAGLMDVYSRWGKEASLRAAAAKTGPLVKMHLSRVMQLQHAM